MSTGRCSSVLTSDQVTACLVTRGDVDVTPILDTLPYRNVLVWDNSRRDDLRTFGRYAVMHDAGTEVVYFQDDDVIFRHHDRLLAQYRRDRTNAVYAHGDTPAGYEDVPLVGAGALAHRSQIDLAIARYLEWFPADDDFLYYCDFAVGPLVPFRQLHLPFEIRDVAYNGRRLADEPWAREAKVRVCNQARWVRDHVIGPSTTSTESRVPV